MKKLALFIYVSGNYKTSIPYHLIQHAAGLAGIGIAHQFSLFCALGQGKQNGHADRQHAAHRNPLHSHRLEQPWRIQGKDTLNGLLIFAAAYLTGGKMVHIEYFALRGEQGEYLGVLEVSHDVTRYRELQGEQRILSYN